MEVKGNYVILHTDFPYHLRIFNNVSTKTGTGNSVQFEMKDGKLEQSVRQHGKKKNQRSL